MEFYPEEREEILARRAEKELKNRMYNPHPMPAKEDGEEASAQGGKETSPLEKRMEKYRKMRKEQKSRVVSVDEFLDSEENQKRYGFRTEVVNGIRNIYYDGDIDILNEAMYGPSVEDDSTDNASEIAIRRSIEDDGLVARLPGRTIEIPVRLEVGKEDTSVAYFSIVTDDGVVLTQLCLTDPKYYPEEENCRYTIDMRGLTILNSYVRDNFQHLIKEWNELHPAHSVSKDNWLPNYRFLASYAYSEMKKNRNKSPD